MTKKMLIDATHSEETRVAIIDGNRLEEFDYESAFRKPLKSNIFLAKVTRVEPSLQAAFVNFGGNRHGFLPFSEIHPDYFRIPIADREALIAEQEALEREAEEAEDDEDDSDDTDQDAVESAADDSDQDDADGADEDSDDLDEEDTDEEDTDEDGADEEGTDADDEEASNSDNDDTDKSESDDDKDDNKRRGRGRGRGGRGRGRRGGRGRRSAHRSQQVEILGGEEYDDDNGAAEKFRFSLRRKYKIQEVIKRGQIMLVQVSREERGNKGAAVSTYLSLPGRYCVLMPNSPRGGGVSRKIANYKDRARMRDMLRSFDIPKGMSVIVRTAGMSRTKAEIKRDLDYLMRLWDNIRELTLESTAPALVYEEADLIKKAVRDLYTRDVEEIEVAGHEAHKAAKDFMKLMIPSHAKKVKEYKEDVPLFHKYRVEEQIREIGEPTAKLKSGGYLVINPTEALVSIDVNSGRATKERHIEETALNTNLEAAQEVARQLRLRDLGGLVVVDFIDMEDRRNNAKVERKLKEALSSDRARIQIGRISSFGLLEMSRQRLNPSLTEAQFETCPTCHGIGNIRTRDAASILVLRAIEEEGIRGRAAQLIVHLSNDVALYLFNHKREHLAEIEERYGLKVKVRVDADMGAGYRIEVSKPADDYVADSDSQQDDDDQQGDQDGNKSERGGRGRGGRGRNRNDNRNDNRRGRGRNNKRYDSDQDQDEAQDNSEDETAGDTSVQEDHSDDKPKKRGSRGRGRKKTDEGPDNVDSAQDDAQSHEAPSDDAEGAKDEKPKRRGRKKKEEAGDDATKAPEASSDDAKATEEKPKSRGRKKKTEDAKVIEKPANDSAQEPKEPENNHAEQFETVNEAPKTKKKGWWNKLVD